MNWFLVLSITNLLSLVRTCSNEQDWIVLDLLTIIIPAFFVCCITITLDVYLSIKAYQLYIKSQGDNGEGLQTRVEDNNKTLQQLKPIFTLLVTISGNIAVTVIACTVYVSTLMVEDKSYQMFTKNVLIPNSPYLTLIVHPLEYGLYFRKIHQPLCRRFKQKTQCCKFKRKLNFVMPSQACNGRSIQNAWM